MRHKYLWAFALMSLALAELSVHSAAQEAAMPAGNVGAQATQPAAPQTPTASQPAPAAPTPPAAATPPATGPGQIRFSFRGATFQQVIDFFSKQTGLPVVWKTPAPEGVLDYISPHAYDVPEALRVLNIVLQSKGVMLRVDDQKLYLQKLDQMVKEDIPTYNGTLPETVTSDQIVTLVRPLSHALAKPLAEKLAGMVAAYGSVMAIEQQNALVITETAANIRRIATILDELDKQDTEGVVEVFKIHNTKASDLMAPLKALLSEKVEKYVINQQGQQVKLEENQMPGLTISADDRTNSIIGKGVQSKIDDLRRTIELLDIPGSGQGRAMTTIALSRIAPADAAAKLTLLYQKLPEKDRPTVVPLDDAAKIMIVGDDDAVNEGSLLIGELEGGPIASNGNKSDLIISVVALERANPAGVVGAITSLLNKRQQSAVKVLAGPDGKSIIISGLQSDVDVVKSLVPVLDRQTSMDRQARLVRIANGDPTAILAQARKIFDQQRQPDDKQMELSAELDADSRVVTLIGSAKALDAFTSTLKQIESSVVIDRVAKRIELANVMPSEVVAPLIALSQQLLQPQDGSQFIAPTFTAVDQLNTLVVTATPQQFNTLDSLITSLDVSKTAGGGGVQPLRILRLRIADAANLANLLTQQYNQRSPVERKSKPVYIASDAQSNSLILAVHPDVMPEIQAMVEELDKTERLDLEGREIRIFPLKVARAQELAKTIDEMFPLPPVPVDVRGRPQPQLQKPREIVVRADVQTNSLIVDAPVQRMAGFDQLVEQLDRQQILEETQVRTYQVVHANLDALAASLRQLAASHALNPSGQDQRVPITINTEPVSQSLIVSGPADIFTRVDQVMKELDVKRTGPATALRFFRLEHARAESVSGMLRDVLVTRIAQDVPDAGTNVQALLNVSADKKTNTLIISAPEAIMPVAEQLIKQLDGGSASLGDPVMRVKALQFADAKEISASLTTAMTGMVSKTTGEPMSVKLIPSPGSNAIIMVGLEADLAEVEQYLAPLDSSTKGADQIQVRAVALMHARAENIAPIVTQLLSAEEIPVWLRYDAINRNREVPKTGPQVRVAADARTNSIVISAPPAVLDVAEQMVAQLDVDPSGSEGGRSVRVLTIDNADAQQLATSLEAIFSAPDQQEQKPTIRVDAASNSLLVRATDAQFKMIEDVVAKIDKATIASSRQMRTLAIDPNKVSAEELARTLQQLLNRGSAAPGGKVQVISLEELLKRKKQPPAGASSMIKDDGCHGQRSAAKSAVQTCVVRESTADSLGGQSLAVAPVEVNAHPLWFTLTVLAIGITQDAPATEPEVTIAVDPATNSLIILGSPRAIERVTALVKQIQDQLPGAPGTIRYITLPQSVDVQGMSTLITQTLEKTTPAAGQIGDLKKRVAIIPDPAGSALIVAANDHDFETVADLIAALSKPAANEYPIRTITLQRAEAEAVAGAIQQFYDDRAKLTRGAGGGADKTGGKRVAVMGVESSNTLLISASDDDFKQIQSLVDQFDTVEASAGLTFRVFQLKHAKATEIERTVQNLVNDLTWNQGDSFIYSWPPPRQQSKKKDTLAVRADARLNSLIVTGKGDKFDVVEKMIEILDAPPPEGEQRIVKLYRVNNAQLQTVADVVKEVFNQNRQPRRSWEPPDPTEIKVRTDEASNVVIVSATAREQDEIKAMIAAIDAQVAPPDQQTLILPVKFARAPELATTLTKFIADRAKATNAAKPSATIVASESANTLIVAAAQNEMATIKDLLAQIDVPDVSGDRVVEILALQQGKADEIARILKEQFGRRVGTTPGVIVTADSRTNSIIVNAPQAEFAQAKALIERLDAPADADETIIRTYSLKAAVADQAVRVLTQTLQLDAAGRTPGKGITIKLEDANATPVEVKAKIVADKRSNSLIVTATQQSFPIIESLISKLDEVPAKNPQEWRIVQLKHAMAPDVASTLTQITRNLDDGQPAPRIETNRLENKLVIAATADQFKQIETILGQIDQPSEQDRITDFVPLHHAQAQKIQEALTMFYGPLAAEADTPGKRNVRIVGDPATNSLVISAEKLEWDGIRKLLERLDSADYDSSLQLKVLPLVYADAQSVARAINDAFQATIQRAARPGTQRVPNLIPGFDFFNQGPQTTLVQADEWVRASAEPQTNAVIVSASKQNIEKVEQIVKQLDVADYTKLPAPRIIPISGGDPVQFANSLMQLYSQSRQTGPGTGSGYPPLSIVGNAPSNSIIVRAEKEDFEQIKALAEALQQQANSGGLTVHVLKLQAASAARVAGALSEAYQAKAKQANQPLSIRVDPTGNSLVIASTGPIFEEIKASVAQLDAMAPAAGQGIFIIELKNVPPDTAKSVIETIGLDKPQPPDSVSRIVSEPIKVSLLAGRNAIVIVANPADRETIVGLMKAIDSDPGLGEAQTRVIKLKHAQATALAQLLTQVLKPGDQQSDTPLARAIKEQVRRLSVAPAQSGATQPAPASLDLTKPIRVIPDPNLNALVVASTSENIAALERMISMFDELPITDTVTVQLFPLQNISAEQFTRIVKDIFTQGKQLGKTAITKVPGVPEGTVGKALLDEIAISTDERTNTVIVAGTEEAVALVEVLSKRIDSDVMGGWVEPKVVHLRFADAGDLAATLQAVLVEGATNLPQSSPIQRQIGRLRMARVQPNGSKVIESDVFSPMTRLVIRPEPQMNAIILVGTPANIEVVSELVTMLDIESASPASTVRIYPVENASASRLAQTIKQLFDQQVQSKAIRSEDRVIVQADERTNALVVATSPRSFAVFEGLLKTLDSKIAPELREIRTIDIKNASATRLASLIQQMMDARLERLRKVQPETADLERATVVADPRTNSLVVAAGNDSFEVIKRLAADLDDNKLGEAALVQVMPLDKGNVERIAQAVNQIMDRRYAELPPELSKSQKPLVLTDLRTNSLLVAANPEDVNSIHDLVTKLANTPQNPAVGINLVTLPASTRAEVIAPRLQRLLAERQASLGASGTPLDKVNIEPDPASNSLIVAASEENLEVIRSFIDVLLAADASGLGKGKEVELVNLNSSRAADVVGMLNDLYVTEANRTRGQNTVKVTADERLNAVLINAPPGDVSALKNLITQLDGSKPATVVEIKYIPLQSANALETVSLIENVLSGRGIGTRRGSRQATVLKYLREIAKVQNGSGATSQPEPTTEPAEDITPVEMEVSAAIRESITLTPDMRTNTIIVSAPRESINMIERMIRDLDESSTGSKNIRIFKLNNADAIAMSEILTELFRLKQGNNLYVLKPREDQAPLATLPPSSGAPEAPSSPPAGGLSGLGGTELSAVPDERQQLAITVDSRTNSLIVSGTPTYLDLVEKVVTELDKLEANEREVFVYQLRNAVAADVAKVVGAFVEQEQKKLVGTLSPDQLGNAARLLEREITIQGDKQSNTVLVSASPRYMDRVKEIIRKLDVDPPQVLIQVMLAEVTLDSTDEWGVNMKIRGSVDGTSFKAGFGLASAFVTGLGVPNLAITSSDFDLLIRAMRSQGRLQVLSNPSIMAANNAPARIQVGETVQVPSSTSISDTGQTNTTLQNEDLGVILSVTPSINPDGFVRMTINPEISNLTDRTTQISADFNTPIITRRTADTTVTVHDGQTIVIGGLISDRFERRDRKVPFFGDLPFVGPLFRSNTENTAKTELLIVLTPHVIDSPTEFDRVDQVTGAEIDRLSLPADVKRQIRQSLLEGTGGLYDASGHKVNVKIDNGKKDQP